MNKRGQEMNMYEFLYNTKETFGDVTAIIDGEVHITYKQLYDIVINFAIQYQSQGLKGKKVDLFAQLSKDWIITYLALMTAGATVVLHEPMFNTQYLMDDIVNTVRAEEIAVCQEHLPMELIIPEADDVATIIYTSGTSGIPKGVMLMQKNIVQDAILGHVKIGEGVLHPGDKTIPVLPVFHMFGITAGIMAPLYVGLTIHLVDDIKYLTKLMSVIQPKILFVVPMIVKTILRRVQTLANAKKVPVSVIKKDIFGNQLDIIVCGGATLDVELIDAYEEIGIQLLNGYGITECSPIVTVSSYHNNVRGSVGTVFGVSNAEIRMIGETVHVSGDIVMKGYINGDVNDFIMIGGKRWFNTHDTGYIDADGNLFITGRKKNLIILEDGNNISPEELETYFERYDMVLDALVYAKKSENITTISVMLYLDSVMTKNYTEAEIEESIQSMIDEINVYLPLYKKIRSWEIRENEFKKTRLGKIVRGAYNFYE